MKSMKAQSAKHRALVQQNRDWREAFKQEMYRCMACSAIADLEVHEMLRGKNRLKAYARRECCLALCRACHEEVQYWPVAKQLWLKVVGDPLWFDLDVIREVYGGGRLVDMADIRKAAGL